MAQYRCIPFLILLICLPHQLRAQEEKQIDWEYEIDLLGRELAEKHKNLFFKTDSALFFKELEHIAAEAPGQSLFHISVRLQQSVARLGDAHTRINYHFNIETGSILPLDCYWFSDGIYILKAGKEYKALLGNRITGINGHGMPEIVDSLATLIVNDNEALIRSEIPRMIIWTQLLHHFGFAPHDSLLLETVDSKGISHALMIRSHARIDEKVSVKPDHLPLGWEDRKTFFRDRYFESEGIYYIQYNKCWSREVEKEYGTGASALFMPSFKEFEKQVFQTIRNNEINKLVFDMRFNNGGNASQGTRFIRKLTRTKYKGEGKIYVLVGRQTFSSAIINTVDFMKMSDPVIVGELTGGRPNHYGEVNRFVLPESKQVVSYSTEYFPLLPNDLPAIQPDVEVAISFDQFMKGIDPAMALIRARDPEQ